MSYDFFVSYSRMNYQRDAREVTSIIAGRGFSVWLDEEQLPSDLTGEPLARALAHAVEESEHLLFFDLRGFLTQIALGAPVGSAGYAEPPSSSTGYAIPLSSSVGYSVGYAEPLSNSAGYDEHTSPQLSSLSTTWQKYERSFMNKVIDIYPPMRTIRFGGPVDNRVLPNQYPEIGYDDYNDAVDKILSELRLTHRHNVSA